MNQLKNGLILATLSRMIHVFPIVIKVFVILHSGLLVLLVLGDEVVHVGLGLGELHLVHALTGVPVEESLRVRKLIRRRRNSIKRFLPSS